MDECESEKFINAALYGGILNFAFNTYDQNEDGVLKLSLKDTKIFNLLEEIRKVVETNEVKAEGSFRVNDPEHDLDAYVKELQKVTTLQKYQNLFDYAAKTYKEINFLKLFDKNMSIFNYYSANFI